MKQVGDILADIKDNDLREQLKSLGRTIENNPRSLDEPQPLPEPQTAKVIRLPLWPEPNHGIPNSLLRGALFAAIQGKDRRYLDREVLAAQKGIWIRFTGMQLNQTDLEVWEHMVSLARKQPLGTPFPFYTKRILASLGRGKGKDQREWLKSVVARLGV